MSQADPFDLWPSGLGFEYFFGFLGGDTNQWHPTLYRNNVPVDASQRPDLLLDQELADEAIRWLHNQKAAEPDKPFFLYYAQGSAHAPHAAPEEWIERFKGQFDQGWDALREESFARQRAAGVIPASAELTPRPDNIPAWDSLSREEQRIHARMMEVYAAMVAYQDQQFGRLIDELERMGELDNTLVLFIEGDNGGSAEGGVGGTTNELAHMVNGLVETPAMMTRLLPDMGGPRTYMLYSWAGPGPPIRPFSGPSRSLPTWAVPAMAWWWPGPRASSRQGRGRAASTTMSSTSPRPSSMWWACLSPRWSMASPSSRWTARSEERRVGKEGRTRVLRGND